MRTILAPVILALGVSTAAPEPEISHMAGAFQLTVDNSVASLVEIESSTERGDRQPVAAQSRTAETDNAIEQGAAAAAAAIAGNAAPGNGETAAGAVEADIARPTRSLTDVCNALVTSAQENDLPVAFFANLIWQESRLREDAVSPKGALGIAQFMPKVAHASGLADPFDPMQALPASAKLLHDLHEQFGNLGFVAAAYNAGAKRVSDWLARHRRLPRETLGYVVSITGHTVQQWTKSSIDEDSLRLARRLPCLDVPAFAQLEQAQARDAARAYAAAMPTANKAAPRQRRWRVRIVLRKHRHGGKRHAATHLDEHRVHKREAHESEARAHATSLGGERQNRA